MAGSTKIIGKRLHYAGHQKTFSF